MFRRVIIESPYRDASPEQQKRNVEYARVCALDSLNRGEAPFLSHLLYTQMLDDSKQEERELGIEAGLAWGKVAEATIVYTDFGISSGMMYGIEAAQKAGRPVEYRSLFS